MILIQRRILPFVVGCLFAGLANGDLVNYFPFEGDTAGILTDTVGGKNMSYDDPDEGELGADKAAPGIGSTQGFGIKTGGDATTADPADLFQAGAFSFALWYQKLDDSGSAQPGIIGVIENSSGFNHNYLLRQPANASSLNFFSRDDSGNVFNTASSVTLNDSDWHHLAVTFDWSGVAGTSATAIIYVDGVETGTETEAVWDGWTAADMTQGGLGQDTFTPSANYDDVRIYDDVLTPGEVAALAVPEPGALSLLAFGLVFLVGARRLGK